MPLSQTFKENELEEVIEVHESMLRAWLIKRFPELLDIDDVIQEAFMKVIVASRKTAIKAPKAYLFATARNVALNHIRKAKVRGENKVAVSELDNVMDEKEGIFESVARKHELKLMTKAIQSLPDRCRQIFTLRKVYGMSQQEIAKQMGLSVNTVYAQVTIGLKKCSDYVEQYRKECE